MLDIEMEFKKGVLVTRLEGVLNGDTVLYFKRNVEDIIKTNGIKYILLNLKQLKFIDKYGLESIKRSHDLLIKNNGKLIICGIDKLFNYNYKFSESLYQVAEESAAYAIVYE